MTHPRRISIFGVTGSIGESTVDLLARTQGHQVVALTGGRNVARLAELARQLRAEVAVVADVALLPDLRAALAGSGVEAAAGPQAIIEAALSPADWVMSAIVGAAGLAPGLAALTTGATLALANKESLVTAGPLMLATAAKHGARILPVDSEHSAIFQALAGEDIATVERIILTASGGALRDWPLEKLASATLQDASAHPNWAMGQRITIDSASMFNKALEVIEAKEFFAVTPAQIEVVIHPESIIHSAVAFHDGAVMAHLGAPDMRHAIGYALNWPARDPLPVARLDFAALGKLTFRAPDLARYPALRLAHEVMQAGGLAGAVFNAAKEVALDHFIAGQIGFMQMSHLVEATLGRLSADPQMGQVATSLDDVMAIDHLARVAARELASGMTKQRKVRQAMDFASTIADLVSSVWTLASFLVAIVVIVTVHEYGHYIVGRWCGIQAEVFSLGFGKRLYAWTDKRGTRWQIAAVPLGGFVRFKGDADASSRADSTALQGLSAAQKRQTMNGAPLWAQAATVVAGPLANFLLALVLFAAVILWKGVAVDQPTIGALKDLPFATPHLQVGDTITKVEGQATPDLSSFLTVADTLSDKPVVHYQVTRADQTLSLDGPNPLPPYAASVQSPSAAEDAGIQAGDVILKAAGQDIASFSQLPKLIEASGGAPVDLTLWRAGETLDVTLTPRSRDLPTADGGFETRWLIGVTGGMVFDPVVRTPSVTEAVSLAWAQGWYMTKVNLSGLGYMVAGKISSCNVSSPIGMAKAVGAAARSGWESFVQTLALVSLSIGLLNLFPIPVLDGGHLVFYAYEAVTGRPNARALQVLMMAGVGLLAALMLFAVFNDVIGCV